MKRHTIVFTLAVIVRARLSAGSYDTIVQST